MADRLEVSPTRGNLLRLERALVDIRSRHDLLDRKRTVLVQELMSRIGQIDALEDEMRTRFRDAHAATWRARMQLGADHLVQASLSPENNVEVRVEVSSIMGVQVPQVAIDVKDSNPPYGMASTSPALDEAREQWIDVLHFLETMIEMISAIWRLATELRKTQRQVNALESTVIPRYEVSIDYIEQRLEEQDREQIVHAKKVKVLRHADGDE